jgi:phosphoribosylglycinamide formyltransferase 1
LTLFKKKLDTPPLKLGVLISGNGSNLQAIMDSIKKGKLHAKVTVVLSNREEAGGIDRALKQNIPAYFIDPKKYATKSAYDLYLAEKFKNYNCDLILLAGYLRLLTPSFIHQFPNKIMNIHPSLLPAFPGLDSQQQAYNYGVRHTGCTVHFVDEGLDSGPIILQEVVEVKPEDTVETLRQGILKEEHKLYSEAIQLYAEDRLKINGRRVTII